MTENYARQTLTQLGNVNRRKRNTSKPNRDNGITINPGTITITIINRTHINPATILIVNRSLPALSEEDTGTTSVFPAEGQITGRTTAPSPETILPAITHQTEPTNRSKLSTITYSLDDKCKNNTSLVDGNVNSNIDNTVKVKGSLRSHLDFWLKINANQYVINVIKEGYRLPLITNPETCHLKNNKSSLENSDFVKEAIQELLNSGSVIETTTKPFVINPLTVAKNKNKCRLVLDLRHVNLHLWKEHIVFEDWKVALDYYNKNCFMYDFDLKSGYHHIDIHEQHQKYLGFAWKFGKTERYFRFTVLPFGLATAGHVFTKVLRCLVKHWRANSIRIIMYLDDGFGIEDDYEIASKNSKIVKQDLEDAGLVENQLKSNWEPRNELTWLGISVDSEASILYIPDSKVNVINNIIDTMIKNKSTTARRLASLAGKINSTNIVLGSVTNMMLKNCHREIMSRVSWDSYFRLDESSLEEIRFWKENFSNLNTRKLNDIQEINRVVYSDASAVGAGGYVVDIKGAKFFKQWEDGEELKSSTWRELKGVYICLQSFSELLKNSVIRWFTDNQGVVRIVQNGSMKQDLHDLALLIYKLCIHENISLTVDWIPRSENTVADTISRSLDTDDWEIETSMFRYLNKLWGPFSIDLFADQDNYKTSRFYTRHWVKNSTGVDAFSYDWSEENCWITPPVKLVAKVIKKLLHDKCTGTLVVPRWPSSVFWPLIVDATGKFRWFVIDHLVFTDCSRLLKTGRNCKIFSKDFKGTMLVLKINTSW